MQRSLELPTVSGAKHIVVLVGFPDQCPRCHRNVVPKSLAAAARDTQTQTVIEEAFQCTSVRCGRLFIASYQLYQYASGSQPATYEVSRLVPIEAQQPAIPQLVSALSPAFAETYTQALAAEAAGLVELTGIGLRKALEFLVKDFAVAEQPGDRTSILAKPLAACIRDYISDSSVKETAKRAAWLGNDATHYLRKWEDRDVNDLKTLIHLTTNGIENVLLSRKYVAEMPDPAAP
jgi:hypothetical protein